MAMIYLIPCGTPIEIARYGRSRRPHVAKRDLVFSEPLRATGDELVFHDGYWQITVPQAMVVATSGGIANPPCEPDCRMAV